MDELFQVVVFVLIGVGWIIKVIAERKKAAAQRSTPKPGPPTTESEIDVHRPAEPARLPPALPQQPTLAPAPAKPLDTSRPVGAARPRLGVLHSSFEEEHPASGITGRHLRTRRSSAQTSQSASQSRTRRRREAAVRRLTAGLSDHPDQSVTRAGVH